MADDRRLLSAFCNAWPKGLAGAATANAIQNRTKLHETEELVRVISFEFEDRFSVVMGREGTYSSALSSTLPSHD
jgi:hypothetical protein